MRSARREGWWPAAALVALLLLGCGRIRFDAPAETDAQNDAFELGVVEMTLRGNAACVRSGDGRIGCWGQNNDGQLGRGTISTLGAPALVPLSSVARVFTGEFTTFAIDLDGALWGWGANDAGQLGIGSITPGEPTPLRVPIAERVTTVAAGQYHTCAITEAGELYCWGGNLCGALGTGDSLHRLSPTKIAGLTNLRQVAVHDYETCIADTSGVVRCFGGVFVGSCVGQHLTPTAPIGLPPVRALEGGCHMAMCAIDTSGTPWCWGESIAGSLGDGSGTRHLDPLPVATLSGVRDIGIGFNVGCATTETGVHCWGANDTGQLGISNPSPMQTTTPIELPSLAQLPIDDLEVGCSTACVRSGHDLYCWGQNDSGIVDDTLVDAFSPALRTGLPL